MVTRRPEAGCPRPWTPGAWRLLPRWVFLCGSCLTWVQLLPSPWQTPHLSSVVGGEEHPVTADGLQKGGGEAAGRAPRREPRGRHRPSGTGWAAGARGPVGACAKQC